MAGGRQAGLRAANRAGPRRSDRDRASCRRPRVVRASRRDPARRADRAAGRSRPRCDRGLSFRPHARRCDRVPRTCGPSRRARHGRVGFPWRRRQARTLLRQRSGGQARASLSVRRGDAASRGFRPPSRRRRGAAGRVRGEAPPPPGLRRASRRNRSGMTPLLEIRGLVKEYQSLRPLRIRELTVAPDAILSIAGLDAIAAETFVHLVTGATLPDAGDVILFGQNTRAIADADSWLKSLDGLGMITARGILIEAFSVLQ